MIYEEGDIIKRALRDIYDNETKYIFVDGNEGYQKTKKFMKELMPKMQNTSKNTEVKYHCFMMLRLKES